MQAAKERRGMEIVKWLGGGVLAVIAYLIVSNTLWLLLGSRLLQSLPGVNIKGFRGTLRIAAMLLLAAVAFALWTVKRPAVWLGVRRVDRQLTAEISLWVGKGSRWVESLQPARRPKDPA
jgi:hypothetical protein